MYQQQIRPLLASSFNQRLTGRDTTDQPGHFFPTFDLQAIRAVIVKPISFQQLITIVDQYLCFYHDSLDLWMY